MQNVTPRTVFVSGFFNVLHPGHIRLLRFARELGDRLIVGVLPDALASDTATVAEASRLEAVQSLRVVDESFILHGSVTSTIERLRPEIVVKGREHLHQENPELQVLSNYGGRLVFSSGDSFLSSTDLILSEVEKQSRPQIDLPSEFMSHHRISRDRLREILECMSRIRVLVVGDSIVDEYISCHPLGMSREDPTLVVAPIENKQFIGGAAIVAAHAASVGNYASLHTVTGLDGNAAFLADELARFAVEGHLHSDESRPTTTKQRWRAGAKTLLRVSHLHQDPISTALQREMLKGIVETIDQYDALIFSDFNYGALPQSLVQKITEIGKQRGVTMAADSQSSSQIGDISRFVGMNLITPTEYEARVATRNFEDGLVVLADDVRKESHADLVLMTLAEDGVFLRGASDCSDEVVTERLPALNSAPSDVAGAGDSLLVVATMALAGGATIYEAALLGSIAAAVQVSTTGNRPIQPQSLMASVTS